MERQVRALYRACLRSAKRCPEYEQREIMRRYVQMKFRDAMGIKDTDRVKRMLADGQEELTQMEYYHSVYAQKQRESSKQSEEQVVCHECGALYQPPSAKFCSQCGSKRK